MSVEMPAPAHSFEAVFHLLPEGHWFGDSKEDKQLLELVKKVVSEEQKEFLSSGGRFSSLVGPRPIKVILHAVSEADALGEVSTQGDRQDSYPEAETDDRTCIGGR